MVQNSQHKDNLFSQIKESYGRIVYTYTAHNKSIGNLTKKYNYIKYLQITLSAISTGGFIISLLGDNKIASIFSGVFSTILLAINLFFKDFSLVEEITSHINASNELWLIKEKYLSLLTDFPILSESEIIGKRDSLIMETHKIYLDAPKTNYKSYKMSQKALRDEEEQFFNSDELSKLLPEHLRDDERSV